MAIALAAAVLLVTGCPYIEYEEGIAGEEGMYSLSLSQEGRFVQAQVTLDWETWQGVVSKAEQDGTPFSVPTDLYLWLRAVPENETADGEGAVFYPAARKRINSEQFYSETSQAITMEIDLPRIAQDGLVPGLGIDRFDGDLDGDFSPPDMKGLEVVVSDGYSYFGDYYKTYSLSHDPAYDQPTEYTASRYRFPSSLPRGIGLSLVTGLSEKAGDFEPFIIPQPGLNFSAEQSLGGQQYTLTYTPPENESMQNISVEGVVDYGLILDDSNVHSRVDEKRTWVIVFEPASNSYYEEADGEGVILHIPSEKDRIISFQTSSGYFYYYAETYYLGYPGTVFMDAENFDTFSVQTEPTDSNWNVAQLGPSTPVQPASYSSDSSKTGTDYALGLSSGSDFFTSYGPGRNDVVTLYEFTLGEAQAFTDNQQIILEFDRFKDLDYSYYDWVDLELEILGGIRETVASWSGPQDVASGYGWMREKLSINSWRIPDVPFRLQLRFTSNEWGTGKGFYMDNLTISVVE